MFHQKFSQNIFLPKQGQPEQRGAEFARIEAFLEKWILENEFIETERYHLVRYEDMIIDPKAHLRRAIAYITPATKLDTDLKLADAVENAKAVRRNRRVVRAYTDAVVSMAHPKTPDDIFLT